MNRVLFEPIPRLREIAPDVHPALETVTMKTLERDPQKRYASAAVFADELEKAARNIHALATVREVAEYVQKVIGQDIAQQREAVRAWLAQSEPSRTELDDHDIIVGMPGGPTSSVSSAAISIPPNSSRRAPRRIFCGDHPREAQAQEQGMGHDARRGAPRRRRAGR